MKRLIPVIASLLTLGLLPPAGAFELNLDISKITSAFSRTKGMKEVDAKGELEIGQAVAANLLGAAPLAQDEELQRYVNRLGLWLASQTERADLEWHFAVLDTDSVNAFAAPGGYVFVTRGLLLRMGSEAELAGVLAHEISHVLKRHHLVAIQKNAKTGLAADLLSIAADNTAGGQYSAWEKKAISASTELYARGLDKEDEFQADRMGVVIAARAGYDPYGLPAVLQMLDGLNPQDSDLALMFKTHPAARQRLELLDEAMSGGFDRYAGQPAVIDRFQRVVGAYARSGR